MQDFDLIVFDLDGTLVDSAGDITASLNHALKALGRPAVDGPEVREMVGHGARALLVKALDESGGGGDDEDLVKRGVQMFMEYYAAHIADHTRPFPHLEDVLDRLSARGVRFAICTNKFEHLARELVTALGWEERFAAILGADTLPYRKPDPRHLMATIAAAGGGNAIYVGDSRTDAETAIAAGIPLILVTLGYSTEPVAELGADRVIDSYATFEDALDEIQSKFSGRRAQGAA